MSSLNVREMEIADIVETASLFEEVQTHYGVPCPSLGEIVAKLNNLPPGVTILVACEQRVTGLAALCAIFPGPGLERGLFLKELFVSKSARGKGVGKRLMQAAAQVAIERGFGRLDWTANRNDPGLQSFYRACGAVEQSEKVFYRLSGQSLNVLATKGSTEQAG